MSREIIININEANKAQKYKDPNELFQIDAFEDVSKILYEHKVNGNLNDISECRFHDTIFIDGNRGVGKTAFMVNIESYYNKHFKVEEKPKYIFLKSVDPTLLEHTEKFLGVIFGKIVEMATKRLKNNCIDEDEYYIDNNCNRKYRNENPSKSCIDGYYKALENLSKSLSAVSSLENKEDVGIEEIASYKSSQKLEQYAHEFFQVVSTMFNVDAIIILIDDVDMAFDKGFDVLEVVRKYLASPFLIPIVAGDMKLYREIVETKFMDKIDFDKDISSYSQMRNIFEKGCIDSKENIKNWDNTKIGCDHELLIENREEIKEKKKLIDNIVKQYLEKLFPNEYHIKLKDIFSILKEKKVQIKFPNDLIVPYTEVKDFEIRHVNLGINQVKFTYQVFSNNTRDLIQYLYSKKEIYIYFFSNQNNTHLKETEHEKYFPQKVMNKYDSLIMDMMIRENKFYKKSLEITSKVYEYGDVKQKELSVLTKNDVQAYRGGRYYIYNAFLSDVFENNTKLNPEEGNDDISIHYRAFDKVKLFNDKEKYIIDLFVHRNYYNTQNKTRNYIFAGSFVELMFFSLNSHSKLNLIEGNEKTVKFNDEITIDTSLNQEFKKIRECYQVDKFDSTHSSELLDEISYKVPFNSIFKKNKNFESGDDINDGKEIFTSIFHKVNFLDELSTDLVVWKNAFLDDIKMNSISMYEIMHKFFNNLNLLKNRKLNSETPLSFMQRIVFIFINAVAFFENTNRRVAETNMAMSIKFDFKSILKNNNAYNQNIRPLLKEKSLTRAMFFHPIITAILVPDDKSEFQLIRFQGQDEDLPMNKFLTEIGFRSGIGEKKRVDIMEVLLNKMNDLSDSDINELSDLKDFKNLMGKIYPFNDDYNRLVKEINKKLENVKE